jgi:DNA-binding NarL/FixJ family response regulator
MSRAISRARRSKEASLGVRVLLADDHDVVRRGLRQLLEQQPGLEVCGEATTGREAVELTARLTPNVVILDLTMPEMNGFEATRRIRKAHPGTEVLIFTMHESEHLIREVLAAGARGYILKSDAAGLIVAAIETLAKHKPFFNAKVSETILDALLRQPQNGEAPPSDTLTSREREVIQLLAESKTNRQIATILGIAPKTVETHRAAIMKKLNLHSIVDIVRYAVRNKLADI